jgi:hypothetical protein
VEQEEESLSDHAPARETFNIYTILYFLVEAARNQAESGEGTLLRDCIGKPNSASFLAIAD